MEPDEIISTAVITVQKEIQYLNPDWMKFKRKERGYSYRFLGKLLGLSAAYLSDIEKGHRRLTKPTIINHAVMLLSCGPRLKDEKSKTL